MPENIPFEGRTAIKAAFLLCLAHTGNVTIAAEFAGTSRAAIYSWRGGDSAFNAQWQEALLEAADRLGNIAWQRAVKGVEVPIYFQGEQIGCRRLFSDRLLMHLLRLAQMNAGKQDTELALDQDSLYAEFEAKLAALIGGDHS